MIDTVIFDLDGTLLDTLDDLTSAVNHSLKTFGYGEFDRNRVRRYVGNGVPKLMERALYFATTGEEPDLENGTFDDRSLFNACLAVFTEYYDKHNADLTKPYDGIPELLDRVKACGLKSAIVTNKYEGAAKELKERFFGTVDVVVGARPGIRPKPAPDGVNEALRSLGSAAEKAVYIGDGETDMKTAAACGMPVVAVTWGFRDENVLRTFDPDCVINSPDEFFGALRNAGLYGTERLS